MSHSLGPVVGLEQTFFRVEEDVGLIQICVKVSFPEINCPIAFPFEILLSTADGTAGKVYSVYLCTV